MKKAFKKEKYKLDLEKRRQQFKVLKTISS